MTRMIVLERSHPAFTSEAVSMGAGVIEKWNAAANHGLIRAEGETFFVRRRCFPREERSFVAEGAPVMFSAPEQEVPEGTRCPLVQFAKLVRR